MTKICYVRAASGSYREKEQRGGGVETKERGKGFGEYQGKKSGWCGVLGRQEQRTKQGSTASNRKVEVAHKTVQRMLRAFIDDHVGEWDNLLPCLEFAMNTTKNKGTGYSPFFLHFGRDPLI